MRFYAEISNSGKIIPVHDSDYDAFKSIRRNTELLFEVKQQRNIKFHKKFFSLINMVFDNQDIFTDIEQLRKELTIESGFYNEYVTFTGEIKREAKSISFASMDDIEFSRLYSKFCDTVIRLMGWDSQMIEENIESYL